MARGGRAAALAAILLCLCAVAMGRALAPAPRRLECPDGWAAIGDEDGERLHCLAAAQRLASSRATSALRLSAGERALFAARGSRTGGLSLATRRLLGAAIDVDRVASSDFEQLPGIGPRLAQRIAAERARRGGFQTVDQLGDVPGIGPSRLAMLREALAPPSL